MSGLRQAGGFVHSSLGQRPKHARAMDVGRYSNGRRWMGKRTVSLNSLSCLPEAELALSKEALAQALTKSRDCRRGDYAN